MNPTVVEPTFDSSAEVHMEEGLRKDMRLVSILLVTVELNLEATDGER